MKTKEGDIRTIKKELSVEGELGGGGGLPLLTDKKMK